METFLLEVTPNSSIKVSFIGYKSQTIAIKAEQKVYNVILQSDNVLIDELVVVGYGVKKETDIDRCCVCRKHERTLFLQKMKVYRIC